MDTWIGLSSLFLMIFNLIWVSRGPRILSTAWLRKKPRWLDGQ
jgi:hypothetical protein